MMSNIEAGETAMPVRSWIAVGQRRFVLRFDFAPRLTKIGLLGQRFQFLQARQIVQPARADVRW